MYCISREKISHIWLCDFWYSQVINQYWSDHGADFSMMEDSKQEPAISGVLQICIQDWIGIVRIKNLALFVWVVWRRATARTLDFECISPLLLKKWALSWQQIELLEDLQVEWRFDYLSYIKALFDAFDPASIPLNRQSFSAAHAPLECTGVQAVNLEALQAEIGRFESCQIVFL